MESSKENSDDSRKASTDEVTYTTEKLDIKYKPLESVDPPVISCASIKIEKFVTLLQDDTVLFPLNTLVDITILFSVEKETPEEQEVDGEPTRTTEYYYASLGYFLQETSIDQPYLYSLLECVDSYEAETSRQLLQIILRLISPKVFKQQVYNLRLESPMLDYGLESLFSSHLSMKLMSIEFALKFREHCIYNSFDPLYSTSPALVWNQIDDLMFLDSLFYAFMMPSFLKYPQILELARILFPLSEVDHSNFRHLHQALGFKLRAWGGYNPTSKQASFHKNQETLPKKATHGETLLLFYRPRSDGMPAYTKMQTYRLFATPDQLKNNEMNVTVLDKEFFRRKLLKNFENTTGDLLSQIQENFHILLNHLSFEEAHFQAYVMTAPFYEFNFIAIESDNITIEKVATKFHQKLSTWYRSPDRVFTYSMHTFRNFIYKDATGEEKMNKYIYDLTKDALTLQSHPYAKAVLEKFTKEWPHSGMNSSTLQDVEIVHAPVDPDRKPDDEAHLPGRPQFQSSSREVPIHLTKDKVVCNLNQLLVVHCFALQLNGFIQNLNVSLKESDRKVFSI